MSLHSEIRGRYDSDQMLLHKIEAEREITEQLVHSGENDREEKVMWNEEQKIVP